MKTPSTLRWLIGLEVKANHPITVLNPTKTFKITQASIEDNKLYVRGEDTMWFESSLITLVEEE